MIRIDLRRFAVVWDFLVLDCASCHATNLLLKLINCTAFGGHLLGKLAKLALLLLALVLEARAGIIEHAHGSLSGVVCAVVGSADIIERLLFGGEAVFKRGQLVIAANVLLLQSLKQLLVRLLGGLSLSVPLSHAAKLLLEPTNLPRELIVLLGGSLAGGFELLGLVPARIDHFAKLPVALFCGVELLAQGLHPLAEALHFTILTDRGGLAFLVAEILVLALKGDDGAAVLL
jgi:hypothetical protein